MIPREKYSESPKHLTDTLGAKKTIFTAYQKGRLKHS